MSEFQKCPECGGETFTEHVFDPCFREFVRVTEDGEIDRSGADGLNYDKHSNGELLRFLMCMKCSFEAVIGIDGKLVAREPEKAAPFSQFDSFEYHHCAEFLESRGVKFVEQMTLEEVMAYDGADIIIDTFWSVYGHFREDLRETNGCLRSLADFHDEEMAKDMTEALNISKGGKL